MENDENIQETQPEQEIELSFDDSDETTEHQEKDWKSEAKKWRDEAFKLKNKKPQNIIKESANSSSPDLKEEVWTIAEFIREGYDRDDVDFILKNGGKTALKDPNSLVSLALKTKSEQRRAEEAASKTTSGGSGEIIGKVSLEDLSKMSTEEMKKHLPHAE